ncbi:MAG: hypothetical protein II885_13870 [Oscillospiraceae bacterium]|nr:hypothetical protein [Oscillospiraceae bacterium]
MKKVLSILLAMLMLTSLGISGYADDDLTTQLVLDRLTEGDEAAQTPSDQAANGALRLAEMVVALDNFSIETQDEADHLNRILDKLAEIDVPEESLDHKLSMGAMKTFEALVIFQQQADSNGQYEGQLQEIFDSFLANDEKAADAKQQAVNGLYHSVLAAALIARGFCRNEGMIKQIEAELNAFNEADKSDAESDVDQLLLGSETLFRMLTATASVLDAGGSFSDEMQTLSENTYSADSEDKDPTYRLANWLYGCVYMTELIAGEIQA